MVDLESAPRPGQIAVGLAPMEGVTDLATRLWFGMVSAPAYQSTPFLRVTTTFPARSLPSAFVPELTRLRGVLSYALIPQLMAASAEDFLRVAEPLLDFAPYVDLNCGCPSPTVVGNRAGSSLLADADAFAAFVGFLATRLGADRLSVKVRTGYESATEFPSLLQSLEGTPLARLAVHGRTRPQRYGGQARWDLIEDAAKVCRFPVVGSGDICDLKSLRERLQEAPHVSGLLIGRGALRNPWVFAEFRHGAAIKLPFAVVPLALACFGMLQQIVIYEPDRLIGLAGDGLFARHCGTDVAAWLQLYHDLCLVHAGRAIAFTELSLERRSFARVKMLWHSMRSSFPPAFMVPQLLRAGDFGAFVDGLSAAHGIAGGSPCYTLIHQTEHDWLYAGQGKAPSGSNDT